MVFSIINKGKKFTIMLKMKLWKDLLENIYGFVFLIDEINICVQIGLKNNQTSFSLYKKYVFYMFVRPII